MFTKSVTSVGRGLVLIKYRSESEWTVLLGYLTISANVRCYYHAVYNNFVYRQDSAVGHLASNTVQLLQCKTLNSLSPQLWPYNSPELNSGDCEI